MKNELKNEFTMLAGLKDKTRNWRLEGTRVHSPIWDAHISRHMDADLKMNKQGGYVPGKGVLRQRELGRQREAVVALGKQVNPGFWSEFSGDTKLHIGFADNRDENRYAEWLDQLSAQLEAAKPSIGKLVNRGPKGGSYVALNKAQADQVEKWRPAWIDEMEERGAFIPSGIVY